MIIRLYLKVTMVMVTILISTCLSAQDINTPGINFYDSKLDDTLSITHYSAIQPQTSKKGFRLINPILKTSYNTAYPRGYNDGPSWKGKGLNTEVHLGFSFNKGGFSATLQPVVYYAENRSYEQSPERITDVSEYSYQFAKIDWIQRYGNSSFADFNLGQSELKYTYKSFSTSLSTKNMTFGPAIFNPLILSNQAAGIPHIEIGLNPTNISFKKQAIFKLEAKIFYGILQESRYFNEDSGDNVRFFSAASLGIIPVKLLPNLKIGVHKALYNSSQFFDATDLLSPIVVLQTSEEEAFVNDSYDQLASLSIDWVFPSVGFRAYAEFAKNDFTGKIRPTLLEPEHSRAYTLGFEKRVLLSADKTLEIVYEHTNLSRNHTYLWRPTPTFYVHSVNRQGFTNNGQIIGAGIGPGGVNDQINLLLNFRSFEVGAWFQRIEKNKDYLVVNLQDKRRHDVEYTQGLFYRQEFDKFWFSSDIGFSQDLSRYYIDSNDHFNLSLSLTLSYKLNED